MQPLDIINRIEQELDGVKPKSTWGETSLFYNPENRLPNGVYFCTVKEKDGDNDKASNLDRDGVFRVSIGLLPQTYKTLFGQKPSRPSKGGIVSTGHDFTVLNELMPHPIYGWMSWAQILSPSIEEFDRIFPAIIESHASAIIKFTQPLWTESP